jgi:DNA helicase-2/ATP-dependent DNA helicase PcrA
MNFSSEQLAVLNSPHRVTVVKACPGSGKTRVFVEALRRSVHKPQRRGCGVAALSFTNAAKDEIAERFGESITSPNFVGTLDSFMLRFVVRPFGHLIGLSPRGVQLVPAPLIQHYDSPAVRCGNNHETVSAFQLNPAAGSIVNPVFSFYDPVRRRTVPLEASYVSEATRAKVKIWKDQGRVSHADCHYLAAKILTDPTIGPTVVEILSRRFPILLVDEFQDTGWFLGRALLALLASPNIKALLVGDPDQAIYEFGGADPSLFEAAMALPGSEQFPLSVTRRCPARVAAVAAALSSSNAQVRPARVNGLGRSILLVHQTSGDERDTSLVERIRPYFDSNETLAILARKTKALERLYGGSAPQISSGSQLPRRINAAVGYLVGGDPSTASKKISSVLGNLINGDPSVSKAKLFEMGIEPAAWRKAQYRLLIESSRVVPGETWNDWLMRVKEATRAALEELGKPVENRTLGSRFKRHEDWEIVRTIPAAEGSAPVEANWPADATLCTIHKAKGMEFDTVVLYVPKPRAPHSPCPSIDWWPTNGAYEERRVAFVAASRAKKAFILCIHKDTYDAMERDQQDFLNLFETIVDCDGSIIYQEENWETIEIIAEENDEPILYSWNCVADGETIEATEGESAEALSQHILQFHPDQDGADEDVMGQIALYFPNEPRRS